MAYFSRIYRDDGSFLANEIPPDCESPIKVYNENSTLVGLSFLIGGKGTCISEY